jgi:2'-5' RNA ligase
MQADSTNEQKSPLRRLFFAWWPSSQVQHQFHELAELNRPNRGARVTRPEKIHLTLAFLGPVDQRFADCARDVAKTIHWQPFSLTFDQLGWFPRARVVWAGCSHPAPQLTEIVSQLSAGLVQCGLEPERRPFRPHLTLARKTNRGPKSSELTPIVCRFERFSLVESMLDANGARYRIIEQYDAATG